LEKKEPKKLLSIRAHRLQQRGSWIQKFFASFFQKRSPCFVVIAAGGTGGHFFPAEALAARLIERGHRITLMTDARSSASASRVFAGHEQHVLRGAGIAGRGFTKGAAALFSLAAGTLRARGLLRGAGAVVAFGGYPSVPPVLAARSLVNRPAIILQEQNAVLGRANRLFASGADILALGFASTTRVPPGTRTAVTGNPVRSEFLRLSGIGYDPPGDIVHLLILGGSLGARVFSDVVPAAVALLPETLRARLRIVQQCRAEDLERVTKSYSALHMNVELSAFFSDVAERLARAHLVIARAGASTCAELAAVGRPSILVPLPGAIDNHQAANAAAIAGAGAALVISQAQLSPSGLASSLQTCLTPTWLIEAAQAAASFARLRAADDLADLVDQQLARIEARA
jgi:UDP-N-acetylglucosamine--N-acetylmuramyl-(pentapeptide) pyrophosphoryl-undecaprenol N-acetylglucosamine transferase